MEANLLLAALAGFIGAVIFTLLIYLLKSFGQDIDIPYLLGTRFMEINNTSQIYITGISLHLLIGAGWGVFYVFTITAMGFTPNWAMGILWGFAHGIFVGAMMGILADTHPHIGEKKPITHPGVLGQNWGTFVPYWILGLHILYGIVTLSLYHRMMGF